MTHKPKIGANRYNQAIEGLYEELGLVAEILAELLAEPLTAMDRTRLLAQASLAVNRATGHVRILREIGEAFKTGNSPPPEATASSLSKKGGG